LGENKAKKVILMVSVFSNAQEIAPWAIEVRRALHACPELGFELPETKRILSEGLNDLGIPYAPVGGSLVGELGAGDRVILLRADCDGLPISEETSLSFAARNGNMHACGHDLHAAMLLGAAHVLKKREKSLPCRVRLLFQGAEETLQGGAEAVRAGVAEGVEAAYMLHVTVGSGLPAGTVVIPPAGRIAPAADLWEITLRGGGGHGSDATLSSPLLTGSALALRLSELFPKGESGALTVGALQSGSAPNVVPHEAVLRGSLRCFDDDLRRELLENMAQSVAHLDGMEGRWRITAHCPVLQNHPAPRSHAAECLPRLLGSERVVTPTVGAGGGSEDFAYVAAAVPACMMALSAGDTPYPLHHPKVIFDEACIPYGIAALVGLVI
jgi:amidohydrolase